MNSNHLDIWFSKTKVRCAITFLLFAAVFSFCCFGMYRCSTAVLLHADTMNYIYLFDNADVEAFFLGRLIFNAMEYLYAGKGILWIVFKSIHPEDVLLMMCTSVILFQDAVLDCAKRMKIFTLILIISGVLILSVYAGFAAFASLQLTTDAGFTYLRMGAFYGLLASIGLIACSAAMSLLMMLKK